MEQTNNNDFSEVTIDDLTTLLEGYIEEKSKTLDALQIAVNDLVSVKNRYTIGSNRLRIKPEKIKEDLGLSKPATEKQQQAYIDDKLCKEVQDIRIAEENVKLLKRKIDLLDDKISLEKYRIQLLMKVL